MFFKKSTRSRLKKYDLNELSRVPHKDEIIPAKVLNVYDGDTITVVFMLNFKTPFRINIRVHGIDAPELKGKGVSDMEKRAAKTVQEYVERLLLNKVVPICIVGWDKYGGRVVADVYIRDYKKKCRDYGETLSELLIKKRYAKEYTGKVKKEEWSAPELLEIVGDINMQYEDINMQ